MAQYKTYYEYYNGEATNYGSPTYSYYSGYGYLDVNSNAYVTYSYYTSGYYYYASSSNYYDYNGTYQTSYQEDNKTDGQDSYAYVYTYYGYGTVTYGYSEYNPSSK